MYADTLLTIVHADQNGIARYSAEGGRVEHVQYRGLFKMNAVLGVVMREKSRGCIKVDAGLRIGGKPVYPIVGGLHLSTEIDQMRARYHGNSSRSVIQRD